MKRIQYKVFSSLLVTSFVLNPLMVSASTPKNKVTPNDNPNPPHTFSLDKVKDNDTQLDSYTDEFARTVGTVSNSLYLSDIEYDESKSSTAYKEIEKDANTDGNKINLLVNGDKTVFLKGIGAHATSTVVYDIGQYSQNYDRLSTYVGVDYAQAGKNSNGVRFTISTSNDGTSWTPVYRSDLMLPDNDADYVEVNIANVRYIKLYAHDSGGNANDHSVYGNLRLLKNGYDTSTEVYDSIKTLSEYDAEIRSLYNSSQTITPEIELKILQRKFVERFGYNNIVTLALHNESNKEALDFIVKDKTNLDLFIEAGPLTNGTGFNSLEAFCNLYASHKADLTVPDYNYIYKRMMIATAVAYSRGTRSYMATWVAPTPWSNPVTRYEQMKKLFDENKFVNTTDYTPDKDEFANYSMPLIRTIMDAKISDDELLWLREYSEYRFPDDMSNRLFDYAYIQYRNVGYNDPELFSEENRTKWDNKYKFTEFGFTKYGEPGARLWMPIEKGGICWALAGLGAVVNEVHGVPSYSYYQPGHEIYVTYNQNADGKGIWTLKDDIVGWSQTFSSWGGNKQSESLTMLGWGHAPWNKNTKNNASYLLLAQGALNEYDKFKESEKYVMLAECYPNGSQTRIDLYTKSLDALNINLNAFTGLVESYNASSKSSSEYLELARKIVDAYTFYPLAMVELIDLIKPKITDSDDMIAVDMLETKALNRAKVASSSESLQNGACQQVAKDLLGQTSSVPATFSFDGEHANTIVMNERYNGNDIRVRYSVDGGSKWTETSEHNIVLSDDEVAQINENTDLMIGLMGVPDNYTIDILPSKTLNDSTIYKNDYENRFYGDLNSLEYSLDEGNTWEDYNENITFNDDFVTRVKLRYKASGLNVSSSTKGYVFQPDNYPSERTYVPIRNLKVKSVSSSANNNRPGDIIDGNMNTGWHTGTEPAEGFRTIILELDKVRYVSALEYMSKYNNGKLADGSVYVSLDGENWDLAGQFGRFSNNAEIKTMNFDESLPAKYIKLVGDVTHGYPINTFFTCNNIDVFEDTTKKFDVSADIRYSTESPTKDNVTAELILPKGCITTGSTIHTFENNGTHTFNYTDPNGDNHSVDAVVTWIDKEKPKGTLNYSNETWTRRPVKITLDNVSSDAKVRYDGKLVNPEKFQKEYTSNTSDTVTLVDNVGNETDIPVNITWIDKNTPIEGFEPIEGIKVESGEETYQNPNILVTDDKDALKTLLDLMTVDLQSILIDYNIVGNKTLYKFELSTKSKSNHLKYIIIKVPNDRGDLLHMIESKFNVEQIQPYVEFSTTEPTKDDVTATLHLPNGFKIVGSQSFNFSKNGSCEFTYLDRLGKENKLIAEVTWIDKIKPTANISYTPNEWTNKEVVATLTEFSEEVDIIGTETKTFKKNGKHNFTIVDKVGNKSVVTAEVNWIDANVVIDGVRPITGVFISNDKPNNIKIDNPKAIEDFINEITNKFTVIITDNGTVNKDFKTYSLELKDNDNSIHVNISVANTKDVVNVIENLLGIGVDGEQNNKPINPDNNGSNNKPTNPDNGGNNKPNVTLSDIENHWAKQEIIRFVTEGHINGYDDKTFKPNRNITRAEFIKLINRVFNFKEKGEVTFKDVNSTNWFYDDVAIASKMGYISGYEDGRFMPNKAITRQEVCVILNNIMKIDDDNFDKLDQYKDNSKVSSWAKEAVEVMLSKYYIGGYEDKTLRPKEKITRAEVVSILGRIK